MWIPSFLAEKISNTKDKAFSATVLRVGMASVALGVMVILISFAVLLGFKKTIKDKLYVMSSHIQLSKITLNQSFEEAPFTLNSDLAEKVKSNTNIEHTEGIILKSAILKSEAEINGILLKGVESTYDWSRFDDNIVEGRSIKFSDSTYSKEILISEKQKQLLACDLNDEILIYFIQEPPRVRKVKIVGIYATGIPELDESFAMVDNGLIRRINGWEADQIGHLELFVKDFEQSQATIDDIYEYLPNDLSLKPITRLLPQFFDWFNLLDRNIVIIIILIMAVAGFNMISVLLIMIMERTPMVGLLKSLGTSDNTIERIFQINAIKIILKGLLWGNVLAAAICCTQQYLRLIPLDAENYYMNYMPISWNWNVFLFVNLGTVLLIALFTVLPALSIRRITPVKALKYKD